MANLNAAFKVKANEFEFSFSKEEIAAADLIKKSPGVFNCIAAHQSVNATLITADDTGKKLSIEIDGEIYQVEIKDELDQVLDKMGFGFTAAKQIKDIKAPMPGMVLEIAVTEGQQVNEGDKVLILGAMKMENSILIPVNATIKNIKVTAGQAVEKGQVLVELE
ncbi:biotin/lipoyl-containing protein [Ferruginibacter sp. SUN106]|uniref:biotin/lipoyl-containing protein n=1 Tax=Ferruginibacter sp. SUN106 TaxID=2978348 RepID=UPI003D36272E